MKQFRKVGSERILTMPESKCGNFVVPVDKGFNREPAEQLQKGSNMISFSFTED